MSYIRKEQPANPGNYGGTRTAEQIRYLVIHYTGNDGDSAAANAAYFQNNLPRTSAHYFVDDHTVCQSVPDLRIAWAVGGKRYASADQTGGGTLYGRVTNTNSISIELCDTLRDGRCQATEATLANAAALCRELMAAYQIPNSHVCRHFDVTGKLCPSYLVDNTAWAAFKARLEDPMTQEQFDAMMENWLARRARMEPDAGSREAREWAQQAGLFTGYADGSMQYKAFCTREQIAILLHRFQALFKT